MPAHRVRPGLVAALLLLASGRPNPAFELAIETVSASATGGTTEDSGDEPTGGTTRVPTSGDSRTGSSGAADGSSDTGDATLTGASATDGDSEGTTGECLEPGAPGDPCGPGGCCAGCSTCQDGTCIPDDAACDVCSACDGEGLCIPKPERAPCELVDDPCAGTVWGLKGGACLRAKSSAGVCQSGECITTPNCEAGEPIAQCDVACIVDPGQCGEGTPVDEVDVAKLCAQDGPTPACTDVCVIDLLGDSAVQKECVAGECKPTGAESCGNYACKEAACNTSCEDMTDCKPPHLCADTQCQ